jgi:HD-like signal output (HDOD) protein
MKINRLQLCIGRAAAQNTRVAAYERLTKLPTLHPTAMKLLTLSTEADSAIAEFEKVFKADVALTADLLLTANSAAYGLRARIETIRHAITLLGLERVRGLACNIMWGSYLRREPVEQAKPLWLHSIATGVIAEALGSLYHLPGLYTAGLLHDLGRLGLLLSAGERYAEMLAVESADVEESMERESALCGLSHCDAGALLARTWGFPELLQVTMVAHHGRRPITSGSPVSLIQTACRMAIWLGFPEVQGEELQQGPLLPQSVLHAPQLDPERLLDRIRQQSAVLTA